MFCARNWISATVASAAAIAVLAATADGTKAAETRKLEQIITVRGSCSAFATIIDQRVKEIVPLTSCAKTLLSTRYSDGRQGFYLTSGKITVTFRGKRIIDTADGFIQDVDGMIYGVEGKTEGMVDAVGACEVTGNPFEGRASFECTAQTKGKKFYISFYSDGTKPVVKNMD